MNIYLELVVLGTTITFLVFAFFRNKRVAELATLTIFASYLFGRTMNTIGDISFLQELKSILGGVADLVLYIEIGLILFVCFFYLGKTNILFRTLAILYVAARLLLEFNIFT